LIYTKCVNVEEQQAMQQLINNKGEIYWLQWIVPRPMGIGRAYMHVQYLSITSVARYSGGDNDELVLCDEIADAAFFAGRFVARVGLDVELEC
jgi:hypothetical protein